MKITTFVFRICFINIFLIIGVSAYGAAEQRVSAKIGIEIISDDSVTPAKLNENLEAGDKLRLYVVPKTDSYVYVVYSDKDTVALLNNNKEQRIVKRDSMLILPSSEEYYQIDGASPVELFIVICSQKELKDISVLFGSTETSYSAWTPLESELIKKSKIDLNEQPESPIPLAGSVRAPNSRYRFLDTIPILSGKALVVKRYEFRVKK